MITSLDVFLNQSFFTSVSSNSEYIRFKIDNDSSEMNSFNWSGSQTSWMNLTLITDLNRTAISYLNYSDANDEAEIDINITVPLTEAPGIKRTKVYIIGQTA